jgi:hypothetical protein
MTDRIRSLLQRVAAADGSLDPLGQRLREHIPTNTVASFEREIAGEIAYSLGRAGTKLDAAIAQAASTRAALLVARPGSCERGALAERFLDERAAAERRLRDLLIQREAIGLRRHAEVHQRYVIPARVDDIERQSG